MKRLWFIILALTCVQLAFSQITNINPDPNGEPWIVGGLRPLTHSDSLYLDSLPKLRLTQDQANRNRPAAIDNSQYPYFRPIFNQQGGSCGQASGIGYNFTYEIDWEREVSADSGENQYPTHYTWNFLNGGSGGGSWYWDGWSIIDAGGCPDVITYGGDYATGGPQRWMSGYESFRTGMENRTLEVSSIFVGDSLGLATLKAWMNDHLDGSEIGGLANFACGMTDYQWIYLNSDSPETGMRCVIQWGDVMNHATTFVGYNDSIRYDYNGDGLYTNDYDINGDEVVDMRDWEIGALIVANSWGESFGDDGKIYMMYKLLAEEVSNGGVWQNTVHVMRARESFIPLLTSKVIMTHDCRNKIKISAGISTDLNAAEPDFVIEFPMFNYQGGELYMQGGENEADKTIEIGLDFTPLLSHIELGQEFRIFLMVNESDPDGTATGSIDYFSIYDETGDEPIEYAWNETTLPIVNNDLTQCYINAVIDFDRVEVPDQELPEASPGYPYEYQFVAQNGEAPYTWSMLMGCDETPFEAEYPDFEGTQVFPNDNDDGSTMQILPFNFPFFGENYEFIYIGTDGSIGFEYGSTSVRNSNTLINTRVITPYGADLLLVEELGDGIWVDHDSHRMKIHWHASRYGNVTFDLDVTAYLYNDGKIEFYYGDIDPSISWVAGISAGDGVNYDLLDISGQMQIEPGYACFYTHPNLPENMELTPEGILMGTPTEPEQSWPITVLVEDNHRVRAQNSFDFTTGVQSTGSDATPALTELHQNVPNPFNPSTTISYSIPGKTDVKLAIYNIRGQKVATLVHETQDAGPHSVTWQGVDHHGKPVSSGIYFYRLEAGDNQLVKKMLLMK